MLPHSKVETIERRGIAGEAQGRQRLGVIPTSLQRFDDAIPWLEQAKSATRYEPRHFPFMNLGRIYAAKGMVNRAIEEFQGALERAPGDPGCTSALAQLRALLN